jgi:hypothetical protein
VPQEVVSPVEAFLAITALMALFHPMSALHMPFNVLLPRGHEAAFGAVKVTL